MAKIPCRHSLLEVRRRASGIHIYSYDMGSSMPWTFVDDVGNLSIPKHGVCYSCGKRVGLPKESK